MAEQNQFHNLRRLENAHAVIWSCHLYIMQKRYVMICHNVASLPVHGMSSLEWHVTDCLLKAVPNLVPGWDVSYHAEHLLCQANTHLTSCFGFS